MQIGKYTLGRLIGQGGAGSVYESMHPQLARPVAVKLIHTNDAVARAEFLKEAQTVAALSHPNIINIFDVDEHLGQPFLVMELIEHSMADRLSQGLLTLTPIVEMILPLLEGLSYAHAQGVIHCDLKPANVLLRADGTPVLADFGLALSARSQPGAPAGTPEYMAPEQIRNQGLDMRTDLYAIGALIYEALTGHTPFEGSVTDVIRGHLTQPPPAPSTHNPTLSTQVDTLVLRLLAKNPADRPQSATEVAAALRLLPGQQPAQQQRIAAPQTVQLPQSALPPKVPLAAARSARRPNLAQLLLAIGIGAILVVIGLVTQLLRQPALDTAGVGAPSALVATAPATRELAPLQLSQLAEAPMAQVASASNTTDFSIAGVTWEDDPNSILFVGELRNESPDARERIKVQIELLNEAGSVLSSGEGYVERSYLRAGEISPFHVYFIDDSIPKVQFSSYRMLVQSTELSEFTQGYSIRDRLQLTVDQVGKSTFGSAPVIRGTLLNARETAIRYPKIIVVFYNEANQVIGVTDTYADTPGAANTLDAQSSGSFETNIVVLTERDATSYMLYAEGSRP